MPPGPRQPSKFRSRRVWSAFCHVGADRVAAGGLQPKVLRTQVSRRPSHRLDLWRNGKEVAQLDLPRLLAKLHGSSPNDLSASSWRQCQQPSC